MGFDCQYHLIARDIGQKKAKKCKKDQQRPKISKSVSRKKFLEFQNITACKVSAESYGSIPRSLFFMPVLVRMQTNMGLGCGPYPNLVKIGLALTQFHPVEGIRAAPGGAEKARSQISKNYFQSNFLLRAYRAHFKYN